MTRRSGSLGGRGIATTMTLALVVLSAPSDAGYLRPGHTERVSVTSSGDQTVDPDPTAIGDASEDTAISANGRYVAFESTATNLAPGDVNGVADIFVHDRRTGETEIVSVSSTGAIATTAVGACAADARNGLVGSFDPIITPNGRYVSFHSCATNLVPNDTNLAQDVFLHDRNTRRTTRVSLGRGGAQAGGLIVGLRSFGGAVTPDGRYVTFSSTATNLVKNDTNNQPDTFLHDRRTKKTELISVGSQQQQGNASSGCSSISRNGRIVAFASNASNFGSDTDEATAFTDAFVRDRKTRKTEWISAPVAPSPGFSGGVTPCGTSSQSISADGRFVLLQGNSAALVPNDQNGAFDVFVYDRETDRMARVSVGSEGSEEGTQNAGTGAISPDGRYVAFWSSVAFFASDTGNLPSSSIPPSATGDPDVFVYDLKTKALDWVSLTSDNKQPSGCSISGLTPGTGNPGISKYPVISGGGRFVAFESCASNLVNGDTNGAPDTFVRDRGPSLAVGRLTAGASVGPQTSGARSSIMTLPDVRGDVHEGLPSADIIEAQLILRPSLGDALAWIELDRLNASAVTASPFAYGLSVEVNGTAYELRATPTPVPFVSSYALYRCDPECDYVQALRGSFGTTGHTVTIGVPLSALGLRRGGRIEDAEAFTSLLAPSAPDLTIVDRAVAAR